LRIYACCGGAKSLVQVCAEKRFEPQYVLNILFEEEIGDDKGKVVSGPKTDIEQFSYADLADMIKKTHHTYLKKNCRKFLN